MAVREDVLVIGMAEEFVVHPATLEEEVVQNVRTILTTIRGAVPLHRDFGLSAEVVDSPLPKAKALLIKEIHQQIALYEPRAKVVKAYVTEDYEGAADGRLCPAVVIRIEGDK